MCEEGVGRVEGLREGLRGVFGGGLGGGGGWKEFEMLDKGCRLESGLFGKFSAA